MSIHLNDDELQALRGLISIARETYVFGIRPFMDYATGIIGVHRGISYQSISEELYVDPHQGIKGGKPTEKQLRHAVEWLERKGLVERHKATNRKDRKLIFRLPLATTDQSVQKKVGSKWADEQGSQKRSNDAALRQEVGNTESSKVGIPPKSEYLSKDKSLTHTPAHGNRLPEDWTLPEDWREWAETERPDLNINLVADTFKDHWLAKPGKDGRKANWNATWRNWVRREKKQRLETTRHEDNRRNHKLSAAERAIEDEKRFERSQQERYGRVYDIAGVRVK